MTSFLDDQSFDVDKLTHKIFSLLENKFLFGGSDVSKHSPTRKSNMLDKTLLQDLNKMDAGKVRILSIDGGDGILAATALAFLEACLCRKAGNPDARIADFFDVATGSGVGGILAALLFTKGKEGRPILKANEALHFLVKNRANLLSRRTLGRIFRSSKAKAGKILHTTFGCSTMKDTLKPVLIPCYDISTRAPFLFSRADSLENESYNFKMSDVCAATIADPTKPGSLKISSADSKTTIVAVDAGVAMNNPTSAAITHVLHNKQEFPFCDGVEDLMVLSLGNGGALDTKCVPDFIKIGGESASDMVDEAVAMAFGGSMANNYIRIQANTHNLAKGGLRNGQKLLEIAREMLSEKSIESVLFKGKRIAEKTNSDKLEWVAGELIKEQETRKMSLLPTVMFRQSSPRTSSASASTMSSL